MKKAILQAAPTRKEYLRRYKAIDRAKKNGLNVALIDCFYKTMAQKGFDQSTIKTVMLLAARDGVFGVATKGER